MILASTLRNKERKQIKLKVSRKWNNKHKSRHQCNRKEKKYKIKK